jgi:hypothetical protein
MGYCTVSCLCALIGDTMGGVVLQTCYRAQRASVMLAYRPAASKGLAVQCTPCDTTQVNCYSARQVAAGW